MDRCNHVWQFQWDDGITKLYHCEKCGDIRLEPSDYSDLNGEIEGCEDCGYLECRCHDMWQEDGL